MGVIWFYLKALSWQPKWRLQGLALLALVSAYTRADGDVVVRRMASARLLLSRSYCSAAKTVTGDKLIFINVLLCMSVIFFRLYLYIRY